MTRANVFRFCALSSNALTRCGAKDKDIEVFKVPGAFEIPLVAKRVARTKRFDALICLGAVIRGATPHFDFVAAEASKGIAGVMMETGLPVIFGVMFLFFPAGPVR